MNLLNLLGASAIVAVRIAEAANSWAGTNNGFAHGLSESEQEAYINELYSDGVSVIRLWVDGIIPGTYGDYGNGVYCEKGSEVTPLTPLETTPGDFNNASLEAIDSFLGRLYNLAPSGQPRIKALISPHNANALTAGTGFQDGYGQWYGTGDFYTNANAISEYQTRLSHIINYESPWFGVPWKSLDYMILAFDIQNEPMNEVGDPSDFDGNGWLCDMAAYMRTELGADNAIKISTGAVGGGYTNYNTASFATSCAEIDIIALHGYESESAWAQYVPSDVNDVNGKLLLVEEWGVGNDVAVDQFGPTVDLFNGAGVPWMYWEVISGSDDTQLSSCSGTCCGQYLDGYEIGPDSSRVSPSYETAVGEANSATAAQSGWSAIVS